MGAYNCWYHQIFPHIAYALPFFSKRKITPASTSIPYCPALASRCRTSLAPVHIAALSARRTGRSRSHTAELGRDPRETLSLRHDVTHAPFPRRYDVTHATATPCRWIERHNARPGYVGYFLRLAGRVLVLYVLTRGQVRPGSRTTRTKARTRTAGGRTRRQERIRIRSEIRPIIVLYSSINLSHTTGALVSYRMNPRRAPSAKQILLIYGACPSNNTMFVFHKHSHVRSPHFFFAWRSPHILPK